MLFSKKPAEEPKDAFGLGALTTPEASQAIENFKKRQGAWKPDPSLKASGYSWRTREEINEIKDPKERGAEEYWARVRGKTGGSSYPLPQPIYSNKNWMDSLSPSISIAGASLAIAAAGFAVALGVSSYVDGTVGDVRAAEIVAGFGYTDVQQTGKSLLFAGYNGCDANDNVAYQFNVTNAVGKSERVVACAALWKEVTVRVRR